MSELSEKIPEVQNYPAIASGLTVTSQEEYGAAGEAVKTLKGLTKAVEDYFGPMKKKAKEAHTEICAKEKAELEPIQKAETLVRARMNDFLRIEEQKRQEAERKLRLAAEEEARKEREKLAAQAAKAEAAGKVEKAESLREKAEDVYVAPVSVAPTVGTVKTDTVTAGMADKLEVSVTDLRAFLAAMLAQNGPLTMIEVKQSALVAWVKVNGVEKYDGLRIEKKKVAVIR